MFNRLIEIKINPINFIIIFIFLLIKKFLQYLIKILKRKQC